MMIARLHTRSNMLSRWLLVAWVFTGSYHGPITPAQANRDDSYYAAGSSNPNANKWLVGHNHYWNDAHNVLQDLAKFKKLYVQFHSCVWSEMLTSDGDGDDDCGGGEGGGGENGNKDSWYMGAVACFRANAAYSLYGVLNNEHDRKCSKATYINSFYTTSGVQTFTQTLAYSGVSSFPNFGNNGEKNENNNNNNLYYSYSNMANYGYGMIDYRSFTSSCAGADDGDDGNYQQGQKINQNSNSYGVGCSGRNYVVKEFGGGHCDGNDVLGTVDQLTNFNKALQTDADCVEIYDKATATFYTTNNGEIQYGDGPAATTANLLSNSVSCQLRDWPNACPDPFGRKSAISRKLNTNTYAFSTSRKDSLWTVSWIFMGCGLVMIFVSLALNMDLMAENLLRQQHAKSNKRRGFFPNLRRKDSTSSGSGVSGESPHKPIYVVEAVAPVPARDAYVPPRSSPKGRSPRSGRSRSHRR